MHSEDELIHEGKLLLVAEGEVGKSSLLTALRGEEFIENRDTTHGIEIKPVHMVHDGTAIVLNGSDFGRQPGPRQDEPQHQERRSAPADPRAGATDRGEPTQAVTVALQERLERIRLQHGDARRRAQALLAIGRDTARRLGEPARSTEHGELLYDERGLPR